MSNETLDKQKVYFQIQKALLKRSSTFVQIVEICDVDKATVSKYLSELVNDGIIILKPKRKQGIEKYTLSVKGKETTKLLLEKQKIKKQIDQMEPKNFHEFKNFVNFMLRSKKGDEFLLKLTPTSSNDAKIKKFKNIETIYSPQG
ncbi:MAG: winged helix-turn-helix domain-containing protein [Candidatus Bathyarchaeota archaeon]